MKAQESTTWRSANALPPALQDLVHEIIADGGLQKRARVDMQLNSRAFHGLVISIGHADGNVWIRVLTRTPVVAAVLNRYVDELRNALIARGVEVASIRVQTIALTSASTSGRS